MTIATVHNYATLLMDDGLGLPYITDVATKKRLYKLPACEICGQVPWVFTIGLTPNHQCRQHDGERRERNDND